MEREREPGDPGIPYDPDAPEKLMPRSATTPPYGPAPERGAPPVEVPASGPRPPDRPGKRKGGWPVAALVIGVIALGSWAGNNGEDGDDGVRSSMARTVVVPPSVNEIRIETTSDDVDVDRALTGAREVTVEHGMVRSRLDGSALVVEPEDDAEIHLPTGIPVTVRTTSGDVDATALASPDVTVETTSGDVDLSWTEPPTNVRVRTTSGNATLDLPAGEFDVSTETNSGDTDVPRTTPGAPNKLDVRTNSGDIDVRQ